MTIEYMVLSASAASVLSEKVNRFIQLGWKPQGGISLEGQAFAFYQAMVKEKEEVV